MSNIVSVGLAQIKKTLLYALFVIEMAVLYKLMHGFVTEGEYFSLSSKFATSYLLTLLITMWTVAILSQVIRSKWEAFLMSLIIMVYAFVLLNNFRMLEAIIGSSVSGLFFIYQLYRVKDVSSDHISIKMRYSSRPATKGFMFITSVIVSLSVFLMSEHDFTINVGDRVAEIVEKPVNQAVKKEYEKIPANIDTTQVEAQSSQILTVLHSLGINDMPSISSLSESTSEGITGSIKKSISNQINSALEPYREFFSPTLALLVFGLFQIYNTIAYIFYSLTIPLVTKILRKTKFVQIEKVQVEKEVLKI